MRWLTLVLALAAACGGEATPSEDPAPPANVTGLITEVTFQGDEVVAFVVQAREDTYELLIDPEYDYGFNLVHLEKHREKELPVHVEISLQSGELYAHEILDA